ncbi:MAG: trimethylamine methyltransferase family protein [Candidatus Thorarchaeota archaeon]|jgi:trimethylamine--corrinoid protein Co-methyltransferase
MITLRFLSKDNIQSIHEATLIVLEETGVRVSNKVANEILREADCSIKDDIVRIHPSLIEESIRKVPSTFDMFSRDGTKDWKVGSDEVIYNPASSAVNFKERGTREIRMGTTRDIIELVKLVENLEHIKFQSTALVPSDVPASVSGLYRLYLTLLHSNKPIVTGAFSKEDLNEMKSLLETVVGGSEELARKPRAIFDCCPISPMTWGDEASQNLLDCADASIPAAIVPAPLSGATSPITIHGTLVQINAEILSGVVISQLKNPGTPIIYGGAPSSFDMKYATPRYGAIEAMIISCASTELGKHYGFPTHSYLGSSDSKLVDAQSGFESGMGVILGALARVNVISGPGMLAHLNCQSLEKLVIDNEICGTAYRLIKGFDLESIEIASELISKVGSDGDYLRQKHTSKKLRSELFMPSSVIDRLSTETWLESGSRSVYDRASDSVAEILNNHTPEPLSSDTEKKLESTLKQIVAKYNVTMNQLPSQ